MSDPTTPIWQRHRALPPDRFRLIPFRSPLLRESLLFSSPRGTQMFQFPRFPPLPLCVQGRVTPHDGCRVSPFGHLRITAWSATPRSFSQPPTSFIGFRRQGIHRWPFIAWRTKRCSCSLSNSQPPGALELEGPALGSETRPPAPEGRAAGCSLKTEQRRVRPIDGAPRRPRSTTRHHDEATE